MDGAAAAGLRQTTVSHMQTVIRPISREPALDLVQRSAEWWVAQPVVVTFSKPVTDRAAAVQTVHITSSRSVTEHFDGSNDATTPSR